MSKKVQLILKNKKVYLKKEKYYNKVKLILK